MMEKPREGECRIDCPFAETEYQYQSQEIGGIGYESQIVREFGFERCPAIGCCECGGKYRSCSNPEHFFRVTNFFIDSYDKDTEEYVFVPFFDHAEILYTIGKSGHILKRYSGSEESVLLGSAGELFDDLKNEQRRAKKVFGIARPVGRSD